MRRETDYSNVLVETSTIYARMRHEPSGLVARARRAVHGPVVPRASLPHMVVSNGRSGRCKPRYGVRSGPCDVRAETVCTGGRAAYREHDQENRSDDSSAGDELQGSRDGRPWLAWRVKVPEWVACEHDRSPFRGSVTQSDMHSGLRIP